MLSQDRTYLGFHKTAKALEIAQLPSEKPILVITSTKETALELKRDLRFFLQDRFISEYIGWDTLPFEGVSPQTYVTAQRLHILSQLFLGNPLLIITTPQALMQKVPDKKFFADRIRTLRGGEQLGKQDLEQLLLHNKFQRVKLVEAVGEYSLRGGVIDFFPAAHQYPVRAKIADDQLYELSFFDPKSQRTTNEADSVLVEPLREIWFDESRSEEQLSILRERGKSLGTPPTELSEILDAFKSEKDFSGKELYQAVGDTSLVDFFSYFPEDGITILDDSLRVESSSDEFYELVEEREARLEEEHYLIPQKEQVYLSPKELQERYSPRISSRFESMDLYEGEEDSSSIIRKKHQSLTELRTAIQSRVGKGNIYEPLRAQVEQWRQKQFRIAFVIGSLPRAERLKRNLLDFNFDSHLETELDGLRWLTGGTRAPITILQGQLSHGVILPDEKIVFVAENEIFGERSYRKASSGKELNIKKLLSSLSQLDEGDYVVHVDYGVGIYRGFTQITVEEDTSDLLQIEYADSMLYLPLTNIGKVQRFSALEGQQPKIDKLSSTRWKKTTQKVRESVATLAGDLIKLYAARSITEGFPFEGPNFDDERFSDDFAFNETEDQLQAINETIEDMSRTKPMDRLICGDVGFGKTEVAMRAAYKAVQSSKQVAMLAPTTILVEQHKQSFRRRFQDFPVKVDALSRFYTPEKNKEVLKKLSEGEIDIVIGTHKLLQKDVDFKDLGLLIIDEEHRFGVKQKERLKQIRKNIDVLSLTATPIPRTLHMSLLELRDISVISTPPTDRRVIRTYLANESDTIIRDAIRRELGRGGQCFFLHNRVQNIEMITQELREIVPEARFDFAHGQFPEGVLEKKMMSFLNHEIDVLVCTTIVESGIDIANANTMLINRADTFGLAQLYQLRGRVGRSTRQAYCYFLVPKSKKMTREARERLEALGALDDLGQGFHLALRDLEIRGAGNLLGKEQSGNVLTVGFELYTKILKEAINNLSDKDIDLDDLIEPEVKVRANAFIPEDYIPDVSERLILYQRLAAISSKEQSLDLTDEIEDRFGTIGKELMNLIELMTFRSLLKGFGVEKVDITDLKISLSFSQKAPIDTTKLLAVIQSDPKHYTLGKNNNLTITDQEYIGRRPESTYQKILSFLDLLN